MLEGAEVGAHGGCVWGCVPGVAGLDGGVPRPPNSALSAQTRRNLTINVDQGRETFGVGVGCRCECLPHHENAKGRNIFPDSLRKLAVLAQSRVKEDSPKLAIERQRAVEI
jgi:hypothetical protein